MSFFFDLHSISTLEWTENLIYNNVFRKLSNAYGEGNPLGTRILYREEKQYT